MEEIQNIYDIIESALALTGYEVAANDVDGLLVYGNDEVSNYSVQIIPEGK